MIPSCSRKGCTSSSQSCDTPCTIWPAGGRLSHDPRLPVECVGLLTIVSAPGLHKAMHQRAGVDHAMHRTSDKGTHAIHKVC